MIKSIIAVPPIADNSSSQYLKPQAVRGIIDRLLTCDRVDSKPTRVPAYTLEELAKKLGITPLQIENLRTVSQSSWSRVAPQVNLSLVKLYCNTEFYETLGSRSFNLKPI